MNQASQLAYICSTAATVQCTIYFSCWCARGFWINRRSTVAERDTTVVVQAIVGHLPDAAPVYEAYS